MGIEIAALAGAFLVLLLVITSVVFSCYRKCPPNCALIISGYGTCEGASTSKVIIGGGGVVFPVIQTCNYLSLETMAIKIEPETPYITKDGTPIKFSSVAQVKVKSDPVSIMTAAELFLKKSDVEVAEIASDEIIGHIRSIVGTMTYNEILQNLNQFSMAVMEASLITLMKQGMTIVSYSVNEMENSSTQLQSLVFEQAMKLQ